MSSPPARPASADEAPASFHPPERVRPATTAALAAVVLFAVPLAELAAHARVSAGVVEVADVVAAARVVEPALAPRDAVAIAPAWADPLLRRALGHRMSLPMVGRSDLAPFERFWLLSIRGAGSPEAPAGPPAFDRQVGPVRVRRWDLGPSPVVADLAARVPEARVTLGEVPCPWRDHGRALGGGLGAGPVTPAARFVCDPARPWLWVATTVVEDLDLTPRHCVWQHPAAGQPVTVRLPDVPLGDRLVLYGGLYYEHERDRRGGPVHARVLLDGTPLGVLTHRDGDGWARLELATPGRAGTTGEVAVEVTAPDPDLRSFCWSATTRRGAR